jgi:hypothetical protein
MMHQGHTQDDGAASLLPPLPLHFAWGRSFFVLLLSTIVPAFCEVIFYVFRYVHSILLYIYNLPPKAKAWAEPGQGQATIGGFGLAQLLRKPKPAQAKPKPVAFGPSRAGTSLVVGCYGGGGVGHVWARCCALR